jgi:hypothetical protein
LEESGFSARGEPDQRGAKHERLSLARDGQGVGLSGDHRATACGEDTKKRKYGELKRTKLFGISRLQLTGKLAFFTIQWSQVGLNGR